MRLMMLLALSLAACGGETPVAEDDATLASAREDGEHAAHGEHGEHGAHGHGDAACDCGSEDCAGHGDSHGEGHADAHGEGHGEHGAACDCGSEDCAGHGDATASTDGWSSFGEPMQSQNTVALSDLLDHPDTYTGQTVRVQGTIADVCQVAGCWMVLADGERTMRITMKEHGFAVDKGAATRTGEVEGTVIARPADPERAAHFAGEASNPDAMPENSGAEMLYEIDATGVRIQS